MRQTVRPPSGHGDASAALLSQVVLSFQMDEACVVPMAGPAASCFRSELPDGQHYTLYLQAFFGHPLEALGVFLVVFISMCIAIQMLHDPSHHRKMVWTPDGPPVARVPRPRARSCGHRLRHSAKR